MQVNNISAKQKIARAGLTLLEKGGSEAVSLRKIARTIGVTPMALYNHFGNREALLRYIIDSEFDKFARIISKQPIYKSAEKQLMHSMDAYIGYAFSRPHVFDYMFSQPRRGARQYPADFLSRRSPTLNPLADAVENWMKRGAIKHGDVSELTMQLWSLAHGYLVLYRAGRIDLTQSEFKKLVERAIGRMFHGLKV